jgi:hypothetical protein
MVVNKRFKGYVTDQWFIYSKEQKIKKLREAFEYLLKSGINEIILLNDDNVVVGYYSMEGTYIYEK